MCAVVSWMARCWQWCPSLCWGVKRSSLPLAVPERRWSPAAHSRAARWALWAWPGLRGAGPGCSAWQRWAESLGFPPTQLHASKADFSPHSVVVLNILLITTFLSLQPVPALLLHSRWHAPHFLHLHLWQVSRRFKPSCCSPDGLFPTGDL